jgi:RNA polymerase sigma-70 factor, ECF subfamily
MSARETSMTSADQHLVIRLRAGERAAFDAFFREYHPKLYRFALRRLANDIPAAEDAAQAAICAALKSLHTYRGEATLMTWLCTICRRQMSARPTSSNFIAVREDDPEVQAALQSLLASEHDDPVAATAAGQVEEAVVAALDYLPGNYADVLEWKYVHELSVEEIAKRLDRSVKATESLLTRARQAFREAFRALRTEESSFVAESYK